MMCSILGICCTHRTGQAAGPTNYANEYAEYVKKHVNTYAEHADYAKKYPIRYAEEYAEYANEYAIAYADKTENMQTITAKKYAV